MSLADAIGFVFVLFLALVVLAALVIEAVWRLRQRNDYLRAATMKKRRELGLTDGVELVPVEHQILSLPHEAFAHDVRFPDDEDSRKSLEHFLDSQFKLARWEFVGFIERKAIVFRRMMQPPIETRGVLGDN